jgi:hypothetical protein
MSHLVKRQRKALYFALAALAAFLTAAPAAARGDDGNIIPHQATYQTLTYGQWQARWQQWAISIPATSNHPFFAGGNVLQAQTGSVWFLAGVVGSPEKRSITIPSGIALFFPVANVECSNLEPDPFHGDTPAARAACANGHIDRTSGLFATVDGRAVQNLQGFRGQSPDFTFGPLPDPNILLGTDDVGLTGQSTDAGFYLLLTPLSIGNHTIHFGGTFDEFNASIDTTYNIAVVPAGRG